MLGWPVSSLIFNHITTPVSRAGGANLALPVSALGLFLLVKAFSLTPFRGFYLSGLFSLRYLLGCVPTSRRWRGSTSWKIGSKCCSPSAGESLFIARSVGGNFSLDVLADSVCQNSSEDIWAGCSAFD
jgi:hypothetical protein